MGVLEQRPVASLLPRLAPAILLPSSPRVQFARNNDTTIAYQDGTKQRIRTVLKVVDLAPGDAAPAFPKRAA